MGAAKLRKQKLVEARTSCIFCGGAEQATTEDHVPARVFFDGRRWPEGFKFPACRACNEATRADEQLMAFIAFLGDANFSPNRSETWDRLKTGVRNNHPEIYRNLLMSPNETRRALRAYNLPRLPGVPLKEHPLVKIPASELNRAARRVGYKIGAALYFRHIRRPLPRDGVCYVYFRTNADVRTRGIDREIIDMVPFKERLIRAQQILDDQVSIFVNHTEDGSGGACLIIFRGGFVIIALTFTDERAASIGADDTDDSLSCFRPTTWRKKFVGKELA